MSYWIFEGNHLIRNFTLSSDQNLILINFIFYDFQKSLPLLRQSLYTKELTIEGIKPPPYNVAFGPHPGNIPVRIQ